MSKIEIIDDLKKKNIEKDLKILLVTAADIEKDKLNERLKPLVGEKDILQYNMDGYIFFIGRFGNYNVIHIQTKIGSLGDGASTLTVNKALNIWSIQMVVMMGIAFGRGPDCNQKIGDILISREVFSYEKCSVKEDREGTIKYMQLGNPYSNAGKNLTSKFKDDKTWNIDNNLRPKIHYGTIASGEKIIDSSSEKEKILEQGRMTYIIGGEMEAAGLAAACSNNKIDEWIIIKGISDWGDGNKVKNKKENQNIAINNVISYCESIFNKDKIFDDILNENPIEILEKIYSFPALNESKDIELVYSYGASLIPMNSIPKNTIQRQNIIEEIKKQLNSEKIINLYGEIYSGKTTIIKLLASQYTEIRYIDLSENNTKQIEDIILIINNIIMETRSSEKFIIAIDNIPKMNKNTKIYNFFTILLRNAIEKNVKIIFSTLTSQKNLLIDESEHICYINADNIEENDIIDLLKINNAPEFMYDIKIIQFIKTIGKSKIYIIRQIIMFLKDEKWDLANNGFIGVLDGKYFLKTKGEIQDILLNRIKETNNKDLLYRIGCINSDLTIDEIKQISEIKPVIERPAEILRELNGKFVEFDEKTNLYKINPLIAQISKENVQNSIYTRINSVLAQNILDKKVLNPYEIIKCLGYLNQAKEYDKAGRLFFQTLNQMYEKDIKDEWGIKGIWKDLDLPDMNSYLKLQIRVAQLRYYIKFKIDYEETLSLTVKLIEKENYEDFLIAGVAVLFIEENPYRFNEILKFALLSNNKNTKMLEYIQKNLPEGKYSKNSVGIESLLWATIPKNGEIELLVSWVDVLNILDKNQYNRFKNTLNGLFDIEKMYMYFIDQTWINLKSGITEDIDKINRLIPINEKIIQFGKRVNDDFITAVSIRNIIIFKCEYLKEKEGFEFGKKEVDSIKDKKSRFIITSMIGKQYYYLKQYENAKMWLEDNLDFNSFDGETSEKIWVLLQLSVIYENIDSLESYKYARETLKIISILESPENKIRFYMEYLIRCFYLNKFESNVDVCLECLKMLLEKKDNIGLISLFANNINYYKAYLVDNIKLEENKKDYWVPTTGMTIYLNDINDRENINHKIYAIYMNVLILLSFYRRKNEMIDLYLLIYQDLNENGIGVSILFPNEIRIFLIEAGYIDKAVQLLKILNICKKNRNKLMATRDKDNPFKLTTMLEEMYRNDKEITINDFEEVFIFNTIFLLIDRNKRIADIDGIDSFKNIDENIRKEYLNIIQTIKEEKEFSRKYIEMIKRIERFEENQAFDIIYRLLSINLLNGKSLVNYQMNFIIYFINVYGEYTTEETILKIFIKKLEQDVNNNKVYINKDIIIQRINEYRNNQKIGNVKKIYIEVLKEIGFDDILEDNIEWLKENDKN